MTAHDLTPDDTRAMRRQGDDWREYLRSEMARGNERRLKPVPPPGQQRSPGRKPGGWPPGTRPPDPEPPPDPAETSRAVAEYRAWLTTGRPRIDATCECRNCQLIDGGNR